MGAGIQRGNAVPVDPIALSLAEARKGAELVPTAGHREPVDRFNVPLIEHATLELARESGLDVPRTRIESLADGRQVMLIERFDRVALPGGLGRRHMVSALTLLALHEQDSPDSSYAAIADALGQHGVGGRIARDRSELYARMVFNILVSNDDDHLRNHAFLYDPPSAGWRLSPLYDVVPKPQRAHERVLHLSVGPQGRLARLDNALAGAGRFGLLPPDAAKIIDRVVRAARSWRVTFERLGVSAGECDRVATAFRRAADIGMQDVRSRSGCVGWRHLLGHLLWQRSREERRPGQDLAEA